MEFSSDPNVADEELRGVILFLVTLGYVDGEFDTREQSFIRGKIADLVQERVRVTPGSAADREKLTEEGTTYFFGFYDEVAKRVDGLFAEAVEQTENAAAYVLANLKVRCLEVLARLTKPSQYSLLSMLDQLILADGVVHPAESQFREEIAALISEEVEVNLGDLLAPVRNIEIRANVQLSHKPVAHPFFASTEIHYSKDPMQLARQLRLDETLVTRTRQLLEKQRKAGEGKLAGKKRVDELFDLGPFMDGFVYSEHPIHGRVHELTVLGDLHGCYSCLKAAVMQSNFFDRVAAYRAAPTKAPIPKLVLLGDYIDRGKFGLEGVMRGALQLFLAMPEHVVIIRGNHEYFIDYNERIFAGVKPSETLSTLQPHVPLSFLRNYVALFEELASVFLFDRVFFVHGGIPRDHTLRERYTDLSSLNDDKLRFEMLWSDPARAEVVPMKLQNQTARFSFGRQQTKAFLHNMGCHTLIRGHEKVEDGYERVFDDPDLLLITLFSAGGIDNKDLPPDSSYRDVTPMALTIRSASGHNDIIPWEIDYRGYNDPAFNTFLRTQAELEFGGGPILIE